MSREQKEKAAQEAYQAALIRYARGEGSREEVRAVDPMRETIRRHAEMMAEAWAKGKR